MIHLTRERWACWVVLIALASIRSAFTDEPPDANSGSAEKSEAVVPIPSAPEEDIAKPGRLGPASPSGGNGSVTKAAVDEVRVADEQLSVGQHQLTLTVMARPQAGLGGAIEESAALDLLVEEDQSVRVVATIETGKKLRIGLRALTEGRLEPGTNFCLDIKTTGAAWTIDRLDLNIDQKPIALRDGTLISRVDREMGHWSAKSKRFSIREFDRNQDRRADVVEFYEPIQGQPLTVAQLVRQERDTNEDGKPDLVTTFLQGVPVDERMDTDFDGRCDLRNRYRAGVIQTKELYAGTASTPKKVFRFDAGRMIRVDEDTNQDGRIDSWSYLDDGAVVRIGLDTDFDGKVDKWLNRSNSN